MPDSPDGQRRRIRWIVALVVFMLTLAAVYMVMTDHRSTARKGVETVNAVDRAP